jgi:predicted aspartyl protease
VKKTKRGAFYLNLDKEIMEKMNLRPFMAAKMKAENGCITISDFEKTVKMKIDISKKTLVLLKKAMKEEGFGSLDETISNLINWYSVKLTGKTTDYHITYLYPEGFLHSKYDSIDDYEKALKNHKTKLRKQSNA